MKITIKLKSERFSWSKDVCCFHLYTLVLKTIDFLTSIVLLFNILARFPEMVMMGGAKVEGLRAFNDLLQC